MQVCVAIRWALYKYSPWTYDYSDSDFRAWTFVRGMCEALSYTNIYQQIPSYTNIYQHIPTYTNIYQHIPTYIIIYHHIQSYTVVQKYSAIAR
jgi:hypothetical protein